MITNIKLGWIFSTHIKPEYYEKSDYEINIIDSNVWKKISKEFYIGEVEILNTNFEKGEIIATNINIVRVNRKRYLVVRNNYIVKFKYETKSNIRNTRKHIEDEVYKCIIESARENTILRKELKVILENYDIYFKKKKKEE